MLYFGRQDLKALLQKQKWLDLPNEGARKDKQPFSRRVPVWLFLVRKENTSLVGKAFTMPCEVPASRITNMTKTSDFCFVKFREHATINSCARERSLALPSDLIKVSTGSRKDLEIRKLAFFQMADSLVNLPH